MQWGPMQIEWKLKNTGTQQSFDLWLNVVCSSAFSHPCGAVVIHRTAPEDQLQIKASATTKDTDGGINPTNMFW